MMSTNNENFVNDVNGATFTSGTSSCKGALRDYQVVIQQNPYGVRVLGRGRRVTKNLHWGAVFGRLEAEHPAAGGQWGSGGKAPSRRRRWGLGAWPTALKNFAFFCKNNLILELFQ